MFNYWHFKEEESRVKLKKNNVKKMSVKQTTLLNSLSNAIINIIKYFNVQQQFKFFVDILQNTFCS